MKKLTFAIPILFLLIHLMYADFGLGIWTTDFVIYGRILAVNVSPSPQTTVYAGSLDSGVVKSTNAGLTWSTVNNGMTYHNSQCLAVSTSNPSILYSGTDSLTSSSSKGVYKSTDAGATWTNVTNDGFTSDRSVQAIVVDPTNPNVVYAGIFNAAHDVTDGLWKTTNGGANWFVANTGMGSDKNILSLAIDPTNSSVVYAGTSFTVTGAVGPTFVYKTTSGGVSWTNSSTGLPSAIADINPVRSISISTANTQYVCAGLFQNTLSGGFFLSTNGGSSWTKMHNGLPAVTGANIRAVLFRPGSTTEIYCAIDAAAPNAGVYRTINGASSWTTIVNGTLQNSYLTRTLSFRAASSDSTVYTGVGTTVNPTTTGQGVYEYSFSIVGIGNNNGNIPKEFALYQNFPNPFNPATYIQYDIPKESFVTLKIYDIAGRKVRELVNETKQAGSYQLLFDASALTSGVYFYTVKAGDFIETKKMMLIK